MSDAIASDSIEVAWKAYHAQLHGFLKSRVGDAADDLLQEVFMRMYERRASLRDVEKLRSWMYRIAHHAVIDFYRARRPMEALPDELTAEEPDADERVIQELAGCMVPMIERLPERYREAVMLSEIRGLSQKEVAERQAISLSGAKSRVQRGRKLLREMLMDCCRFEFDLLGRVGDCERKAGECEKC